MKTLLGLFILLCGIQSFAQTGDVYRDIFNAVDRADTINILKNMTGVNPVNVGGRSFSISERYSSQGKQNFRAYFTDFFTKLGIPVQELAYKTRHSQIEPMGHNLEAVLPGKTADSVVIIIHYDSMGPSGHQTGNPAVDDDMTGMAMMLETARVLVPLKNKLNYTVRFVAADFEEWMFPGLEGARQYAQYISKLSQTNGFKVVASIDNEQSGWSGGSTTTVNVFSCQGGNTHFPNSNPLGDLLEDTFKTYSTLAVQRECMGANSDFYAMLEVGVPSVVFSEYNPFNNPHFDDEGGDTFDLIDQDYFFKISQVAVTFAARVIGVNTPGALEIPLN